MSGGGGSAIALERLSSREEYDALLTRLRLAAGLQPFITPAKDQRQQVGRFCHTLAAAAFLEAVGVWHSTRVRTLARRQAQFQSGREFLC
jgi:hypothetical protein